jgi:hypothetical protein
MGHSVGEFNYSQIQSEYQNPSAEMHQAFPIHGDPITCNLNPLIFNNILSCQYFKEEIISKNFNEIIEEIIKNVNNIESWAVASAEYHQLFSAVYTNSCF